MRYLFVVVRCGADVSIKVAAEGVIEVLELRHALIDQFDGLEALRSGGVGNLLAVLVGTCQEVDLTTVCPVPRSIIRTGGVDNDITR